MTNAFSALKNSGIIRKLTARFIQTESGQSLMEMSLALLIMLPVTFGIIDFSRGIYVASVINAAAQEGARAGIIDEGEIMNAIQSKMFGLNMARAAVDIGSSQPEVIDVSITYDFAFVTPLTQAFSDGIELTGSASMIKQ